MADPIWRTKMQKIADFVKIWYSGFFWIVDYKPKLKIQKFKRTVLNFIFQALFSLMVLVKINVEDVPSD